MSPSPGLLHLELRHKFLVQPPPSLFADETKNVTMFFYFVSQLKDVVAVAVDVFVDVVVAAVAVDVVVDVVAVVVVVGVLASSSYSLMSLRNRPISNSDAATKLWPENLKVEKQNSAFRVIFSRFCATPFALTE